MTDDEDALPVIDPGTIRPYGSIVVVECLVDDQEAAFKLLCDFLLRASKRSRAPNSSAIVASGMGNSQRISQEDGDPGDIDAIYAFIYQRTRIPSWAVEDSIYKNTEYSLAVLVRRRKLIAIHCDSSLQSSLQRWLDKPPLPPVRRVPAELFQGALLRGEAKSLWLHGTHSPRTTRPDSKNLSGRKLQDALNPLEDGSFAMNSARAALPRDESRVALVGNIGTTPRKALMWSKPTTDFDEFVAVALEAMNLIEETADTDSGVDRPYPVLAVESTDLSAVFGAYDVMTIGSDSLPTAPDVDPDLIDAAATLERAILNIHGRADSAEFVLDVGLDGAIGGSLRGTVARIGRRIRFNFGYEGEPTNPDPVRQVLEALRYGDELLTVYYDSGHMVDGRAIWSPQVRPARFPGWSFYDFENFNIAQEKPDGDSPQKIHNAIALSGDNSLFAWVVMHYSSGWLICDDGPGEVADFIHVAQDYTLSFIHVKAANSRSASRHVAVGAYEVVASQAEKNLLNIDLASLRQRLESPMVPSPASWIDGQRTEGRAEFMDALQYHFPKDEKRVVIVQPHISRDLYRRVHATSPPGQPFQDLYRMRLLETLLNGTRGTVVSVGADLIVIGSMA
jgi:hypothetical protein